jgi:hypothetical protein
MTLLKMIMITSRFASDSLTRNVFRIGTNHVGNHRMREGALVSRFNRSEAYRKRYKGKHLYSIWKECYGPGARAATVTS